MSSRKTRLQSAAFAAKVGQAKSAPVVKKEKASKPSDPLAIYLLLALIVLSAVVGAWQSIGSSPWTSGKK